MMRRNALAMGAAVLAAAPVVMSPFSACADFEPPLNEQLWDDFKAWETEIDGLGSPSEWTALISSGFGLYYGNIAGLVYAVYSSETAAVVPGDFGGAGGIYTDSNGVQRYGSVYTYTRSYDTIGWEPVPHTAFLALADSVYSIELTPTYASSDTYPYTWTFTPGSYNNSDGSFVRSITVRRYHTGGYQERMYTSWDVGSGSDRASGNVGSGYDVTFSVKMTSAAVSPTWPGISAAIQGQTPVFGAGVSLGDLPTSEDFPTLTRDNLGDYIRDVLNPAIVEDDPAIEPYLFTPSEPYEPIYPTDFAEGIPKAWTVENPRLPSYSLDLQLPTADYETIDVATPIEQNANGIRFWWAMLGTLLDHFGLKSLVALACALGLFLLILTRLGR